MKYLDLVFLALVIFALVIYNEGKTESLNWGDYSSDDIVDVYGPPVDGACPTCPMCWDY